MNTCWKPTLMHWWHVLAHGLPNGVEDPLGLSQTRYLRILIGSSIAGWLTRPSAKMRRWDFWVSPDGKWQLLTDLLCAFWCWMGVDFLFLQSSSQVRKAYKNSDSPIFVSGVNTLIDTYNHSYP